MKVEELKLESLSIGPGPAGGKVSCLAWAGWVAWIPSLWRPLGIHGGLPKGTLLVGDGQRAVAQFKWKRIDRKDFDERRWTEKRLRKVAGRSYRNTSMMDGKTGDFKQLAWLEAGQLKRRSRSQTALWYGFSRPGRMLLEVVVNAAAGEGVVRTLRSDVLPSLRACNADGPTGWSLFDTSFVSPAGFDVRNKRINLGDIALEFVSAGRRMVARQVYPAQLALQRRALEKWLTDSPFLQRRRFKANGPVEQAEVEARTGPVTAHCRVGRKKLPFPLGFVSRRFSVAAVVEEPRLDRLMMAEYDWPWHGGQDPRDGLKAVAWALGQMNWSRRGRKDGPA